MFILGLSFLSIGAMQLIGFYSYCWLASLQEELYLYGNVVVKNHN